MKQLAMCLILMAVKTRLHAHEKDVAAAQHKMLEMATNSNSATRALSKPLPHAA